MKGIEYNMSSFIEQCVSAYLELAGLPVTKLSAKAATPFTDETNAFTTEEPEGKLTNIALKVLMKILYAAGYCRPDLLRATCALARRVSKWTTECDRRLHRLVSYMHLTVNSKQYAYVGDDFSQCTIALFADADYAGDKTNSLSTSGVFIAIVGPRTYVPIVAVSKKQTCTSHSTCEAEVVAFNTGLKAALPIMDLWEAIMPYFSPAKAGAVRTAKLEAAKIDPGSFAGGVPPDSARLAGADALDSHEPGQFSAELYIFEDNTSTICVLEKGASNKLAHLTRTHRVNLHWLSEVCASQGIHVGHIGTDDQAGDIFTKAFTDPLKWDTLTKLVGMYESNVFRSHQGSSSSG